MQKSPLDFETQTEKMAWMKSIAVYNNPDLKRSVWQIVNSFVPYIGLWLLMLMSINVSYWLTLALMPLAAGFLVRIFIIFHDCGHGSFFKSQKANHILEKVFLRSLVLLIHLNKRKK